jgi:DNA-directed RNA polymerase
MVDRGAERYRERVGEALEKEEMTALPPYRRILEEMVEAAGKGIHAWMNNIAKRKKGFPLSYKLLTEHGLSPHVVAYITARCLLDVMTIERIAYAGIAHKIGQEVEYEARMQAWLSMEKRRKQRNGKRSTKDGKRKVRTGSLFTATQQRLKNQRATALHRKRVNINVFNRLIKQKVNWRPWSRTEKIHVGSDLIDLLARITGHIEIMEDPTFRRISKKQAPYVVQPSEELLAYLTTSTERDATRHPQHLPCVIPPKQWSSTKRGGYYTPMVTIPRLIRFKADNEEVQDIAAEEYDSLDMPRVYDALNRVQEVPWKINQKVLGVVIEAWERDLAIAGLRKRNPLALPPTNPGQRRPDLKGEEKRTAEAEWVKANGQAFKDWRRLAAKTYSENARRVSAAMGVRTTIEIAEMYANTEFYFPHMLDFRGRMYPIPAYLQPQGDDLARGLLTFGRARPVGDHGLGWLQVHLANCWGVDKVSYTDRMDWVDARWDLFTAIYTDPLRNLEWTKADDPWQALAAVFEYVRVFSSEKPSEALSGLPIRVDGTCNGIQHLSAMMRDPVGAASVNLLPSEAPRDIYAEVGVILRDRLIGIRDAGGLEGQHADQWLKPLNAEIPRKLTKRPVMVTPYGGTKESFKKYILEYVTEDAPRLIPEDDRFRAALWLTPHMMDAVEGKVGKAKECMKFLQDCARAVAETGQPLWWTTVTGFHIRHFYGTTVQKQIGTMVDGKRVQLRYQTKSKKLSKRDQFKGIAPNFTHSQDAAVNMETVMGFVAGDEPPPFTTIHDAFGTVAGEMANLGVCIRQAFVGVHSVDVLAQFRDRCVMLLRDWLMATKVKWDLEQCWEEADGLVPALPERGELDLMEVLDAEYFFA